MNDFISFCIAVFACLVVCGIAVAGVHAILGQWSMLVWVAVGFSVLMGVMRRVNA